MRRFVFSIALLLSCVVSAYAQQFVKHVVEVGETLNSIAEKYSVPRATIKKDNPELESFFYAGMKLRIRVEEETAEKSEPTQESVIESTPVSVTNTDSVTDKKQTEYYTQTKAYTYKDIYPKLKFSCTVTAADIYIPTVDEGQDLQVSFGGSYGAGLDIMISEGIGFGALFEYRWTRLSNTSNGIETTSVSHNLGAPIQFSILSDDQFGFGVRFGMYLGGNIASTTRNKSKNYSKKESNDRVKGLMWGPQVDLVLGSVDIRYRATFFKDYTKYPTHTISLGFNF